MSNDILFTQSVAHATEVMHALLFNGLPEWADARMEFPTGEPFTTIRTGDHYDKKGAQRLMSRISTFCATLKKVRITRILPGSLPVQDVFPVGDADPRTIRAVNFHLGNERDPEQIIVRILLEHLDGDVQNGGIWDEWGLSGVSGITCLKHPDSRFINYDIDSA